VVILCRCIYITSLHVVAAYRHRNTHKRPSETAEWWADIVAKAKNAAFTNAKGILIAGDLNAENDLWLGKATEIKTISERRHPEHGEEIAKIASCADLYAVLDRDNPFTRMGGQIPSAIDVIWTSHRILGKLVKTWGTSDHVYMEIGGDEASDVTKPQPKPEGKRTQFKAVNTRKVAAILKHEEKVTPGAPSRWKELAQLCKRHTREFRHTPKESNSWWTEELSKLKKVARKTAERYAERPRCSNRKEQRDVARRVYRKTMRQTRRAHVEAETKALIEKEGTEVEALYKQRALLLTPFKERSDDAPSPQRDRETTRETAERLAAHNFPPPGERSVAQLTLAHQPPKPLWKAVRKAASRRKTAAGPDGINSKLANKFLNDPEIEEILAEEMEQAWHRGTPEPGWREVRIKYIPKPGKKTWTEAATWRPVGVMNTAGKWYSAGVVQDLQAKIEWKAPVFGARKGIGCIDIALRHANLFQHVANTNSRPIVDRPTLIGVYFDVKAAYPGTQT